MTKISKTARASIVNWVAESREYDAATVQITHDGNVTAKKDQNKTHQFDGARYLVARVSDMVDASGAIRPDF